MEVTIIEVVMMIENLHVEQLPGSPPQAFKKDLAYSLLVVVI